MQVPPPTGLDHPDHAPQLQSVPRYRGSGEHRGDAGCGLPLDRGTQVLGRQVRVHVCTQVRGQQLRSRPPARRPQPDRGQPKHVEAAKPAKHAHDRRRFGAAPHVPILQVSSFRRGLALGTLPRPPARCVFAVSAALVPNVGIRHDRHRSKDGRAGISPAPSARRCARGMLADRPVRGLTLADLRPGTAARRAAEAPVAELGRLLRAARG